MQSPGWTRTARALRGLALVISLAYVAAYVGIALTRLSYPFELEWMEGGMVDHVRRVLAGQPIYAAPQLDFVSYLYPPLYYWVCAPVCSVWGLGFFPLRLVSFLSSLGAFALVFRFVKRETGDTGAGIIALGLFAATFHACGAWFDLARADSFFVLLFLGALYLARFGSSSASQIAGGLLLAGACLTKQSAIVMALPVVLHGLLTQWRRTALFAGTAAIIVAAIVVALDRATGGWFAYYCLSIPAKHPLGPGLIGRFWPHDLLGPLGIACAFALYFVFSRIARAFTWKRQFYSFLLAGLTASAWSVRSVVGAETNNLIPLYAVLAVITGLGLHDALGRIARGAARFAGAMQVALFLCVCVQFALLVYDPRGQIPTRADRAAGWALVQKLAAIKGEVFIPHHGYLALLAGKRGFAHTLAMDNLFLDDPGQARQALEQQLQRALAERRFAAVVLESDGRYGNLVAAGYEIRERLFAAGSDAFFPVTGGRLRPEYLCVPKTLPRAAP